MGLKPALVKRYYVVEEDVWNVLRKRFGSGEYRIPNVSVDFEPVPSSSKNYVVVTFFTAPDAKMLKRVESQLSEYIEQVKHDLSLGRRIKKILSEMTAASLLDSLGVDKIWD